MTLKIKEEDKLAKGRDSKDYHDEVKKNRVSWAGFNILEVYHCTS